LTATSSACPLVPSEPQEHSLQTETGLAIKSGVILVRSAFYLEEKIGRSQGCSGPSLAHENARDKAIGNSALDLPVAQQAMVSLMCGTNKYPETADLPFPALMLIDSVKQETFYWCSDHRSMAYKSITPLWECFPYLPLSCVPLTGAGHECAPTSGTLSGHQ
jgi:hypothetical protein